jgi:hypothetical protein
MVKVVLGFLGFYCVMINLLILYYKAINVSKIVRSLHFKLPRSRYYYQAKVSNKPISDTTNSMIQSMRKISIETGYTYGKRIIWVNDCPERTRRLPFLGFHYPF